MKTPQNNGPPVIQEVVILNTFPRILLSNLKVVSLKYREYKKRLDATSYYIKQLYFNNRFDFSVFSISRNRWQTADGRRQRRMRQTSNNRSSCISGKFASGSVAQHTADRFYYPSWIKMDIIEAAEDSDVDLTFSYLLLHSRCGCYIILVTNGLSKSS